MIETEFALCVVIVLAGFSIIASVPILTWYWLATYDFMKGDDDEV